MRKTDQPAVSNSLLKASFSFWDQARSQHHIPITGRSMVPLLREGDLILVEHNVSGIEPGDIILFRNHTGLVAHRLLVTLQDGERTTWVTKGDNLLQPDIHLGQGDLVGQVVAIRRNGKDYSLKTPHMHRLSRITVALMRAESMFYHFSQQKSSSLAGKLALKIASVLLTCSQTLNKIGIYYLIR